MEAFENRRQAQRFDLAPHAGDPRERKKSIRTRPYYLLKVRPGVRGRKHANFRQRRLGAN